MTLLNVGMVPRTTYCTIAKMVLCGPLDVPSSKTTLSGSIRACESSYRAPAGHTLPLWGRVTRRVPATGGGQQEVGETSRK